MTTIELRRDEVGEDDRLIAKYPVEVVPVVGDTIYVSYRGWLVRVVSRHWVHRTSQVTSPKATVLVVLGVQILEDN